MAADPEGLSIEAQHRPPAVGLQLDPGAPL